MKPFKSRESKTAGAIFGTALIGLVLSGCADVAATGNLEKPVAETPAVVEESVAVSGPLPASQPVRSAPRQGVLTAGDIDDSLNLATFVSLQSKASKALGLPRADLSTPVLATFVGEDNEPAPGVRFTLRKPDFAQPFYDGVSGVDGAVSVFPAALGAGRIPEVEIRAFTEGSDAQITQVLKNNGTRQIVRVPGNQTWQPDFLDLAFVIDTTGSMGDEMEWLLKDLSSILRQAKRSASDINIRLGLVVYKSRGDRYVVKSYGFTRSQKQFRNWLSGELPTSGGSGYPEAVADALEAGVSLNWRRGRGERLLFQIGDEPPHPTQTRTYLNAARDATLKGVQIFSVEASSQGPHLEYLMRQGALVSNGRYIFLTDDSGVGFAHSEPSTTCYRVTRLNDLMVRVIQSELQGHRIEAPSRDVIREVGSYRSGVCLN
ncbi:vWA domain-containing protein [Ruegeria sp. HKCCD8929]|uniref:vWA domain-containing protein n=1 Tax=Ruegeria sp. HKCCD8929 TaxID=2683006 RepID=UPI0014882835|nr:vWA domain-containing protein [Ruegeria sp. HKCCD8929]